MFQTHSGHHCRLDRSSVEVLQSNQKSGEGTLWMLLEEDTLMAVFGKMKTFEEGKL